MIIKYLLSLCIERGESLTNVLTKLNISSGSGTNWRKGAKPREETLQKIADYFNVPVEALKCGPISYKLRKIMSESPPHLDTLCTFLNISRAEWEQWLEGNDDSLYDHADKIADYFDTTDTWLKSFKDLDKDFAIKHIFTPYKYERDINLDRLDEEALKELQEKSATIHAALTSKTPVIIVKDINGKIHIRNGEYKELSKAIRMLDIFDLKEFNIDSE